MPLIKINKIPRVFSLLLISSWMQFLLYTAVLKKNINSTIEIAYID
jgi:hypothetical protein